MVVWAWVWRVCRAESVVLHRTEQILKSRDRNLDDFLRQLEAKKGVLGYRETQEKLEKASEATAAVDSIKGQVSQSAPEAAGLGCEVEVAERAMV